MKILNRGASFARRLSVFYLFVIVGVLFFGFFYYKYIPGNQSELDSRGFRILNQLSTNIVRKNDEIAATFENFAKSSNIRYGSRNDREMRRQLSRNLKFDIDSSIVYKKPKPKKYERVEFYEGRNWKFIYDYYQYRATVGMNDFLEPVLEARDDLFNAYLLMKKTSVDPDSSNARRMGGMDILYISANLSATTKFNTDSAWALQNNSDLANVTDVLISGVSYKLFSRPFSLGSEKMVLAGVISNSDYERQVKALPVRFISTMLISILMAIIFLPFIKVFLLSPKENMNRLDVLGTTLSIYAGSSMLVLIGFYLVIYYVTVNTFSNRLLNIASEITLETEKEISAASDQIDAYSEIYKSLEKPEKEVLYYRQNDTSIKNQVDTKFIPELYKNIYRVFWIDKDGNTLAKWNPFAFDAPLSSTKDYTYYKLLKEKTPDDHSLVVYPGKSNVTGEFQVFFMKRNAALIKTVKGLEKESLALGIAGFLDISIRPVLPAGFGFCVVDNRTGDILIHSDYRRSLSENILTETGQNEQLSGCLQNKTSGRMAEVSLYGLPHMMYVNPIKGQNLSLVTFYNTDAFSVNIFRMLHFTAETVLYIFIALVLCVFFSTRYKSGPSRLEFKLDPVEWVRPCEKNILSYVFTKSFFLVLLLYSVAVFALIFLTAADVRSIYYICLLIPFYSMWGFLASRRRETGDGHPKIYLVLFELLSLSKTTVCFILLVNWIIFSLLANSNYGHPESVKLYVIYFQVGALLIQIICFRWAFGKESKYSTAEARKDFSEFYNWSLYFSVLLMSILPVSGIILYSLNAEKIQYCKTDEYAVANNDQIRQQFLVSSLMPDYKKSVRQNFQTTGYFGALADSDNYYLDGERLTHDVKECADSTFYDEPYITMLDDLFLITSGEYNSYSLHTGAMDSSWSFSNLDTGKICMSKYIVSDSTHKNYSTDKTFKNIRVNTAYASLLYSFANVNAIFPIVMIVLGILFLWFGRRFFIMLVSRIFLLNFIPETYPLKQNEDWISTFHPEGSTENDEMQILERSIANTKIFQKIWDSLEPAEQYLLYDFALDGYTNYKDARTIVKLLQKTLLAYENNELKYFDLAFRNFILTKKGTPDVEELKQKYSVPGIWQTIRIPALVLIAVTAIFLLLTQENVSHKLAGLITSVGALIPLALEITKRAAGKTS